MPKVKDWPIVPENILPFDEWCEAYKYWRYESRLPLWSLSAVKKKLAYKEFKSEKIKTFEDFIAFKNLECRGWIILAPTSKHMTFLIKHFCGEERFIELRSIKSFNTTNVKKCQECWSLGRKFSLEVQIQRRKEWLKLFHAVTNDTLNIEDEIKVNKYG